MKKLNWYWLSLFTMVICGSKCFSQDFYKSGNYSYTLSASLSAVNLRLSDKVYDKNFGIGFRLAAAKHLKLSPSSEVVLGISYSQSGVSYLTIFPKYPIDTVNFFNSFSIYRQQVRLHFLDAKVGLNKNIYSTEAMKIYVGLHAYTGILINARLKGKELQGTNVYNNPASDAYTLFNWGIEPEIGLKLRLADTRLLQVSLSNKYGLSNLRSNSSAPREYIYNYNLNIIFPIYGEKLD